MRANRISARGFRNLAPLDLPLPTAGAAILGPNGHGKTSLIELLAYPVVWRSARGAPDQELVQFGEPAFHLRVEFEGRSVEAGFLRAEKKKRLVVDGLEQRRLGPAIGHWAAVTFLPTDLGLIQGPAAERRRYLDQMLSLANPDYLGHLSRFRVALAHRNAALRQGRPELAEPFGPALARHGAALIAARLGWVQDTAAQFAAECDGLGELAPVGLEYRGRLELADPEAWTPALRESLARDQVLRSTGIGPHRDDLTVTIGGRGSREFGSTGQQRGAAIALRLAEMTTLAASRGTEPVLLLDDVFAELDDERQSRLAARLSQGGERQVFVTAPRRDELPKALTLEVLRVESGMVWKDGNG
ncbi:MAG: DNA replication and repair protein RecF [Gemmatimonadota bacterium]|nr:DNA replication and repair protein RecF [Gemmatimonadota bacterium]